MKDVILSCLLLGACVISLEFEELLANSKYGVFMRFYKGYHNTVVFYGYMPIAAKFYIFLLGVHIV